MTKIKPWSKLEGMPIRFDVNSTTEEAMNTQNPSTVYFTKDGRVLMNACILGDKNPNRGVWDGRVVVNRAIPEFPRAGMAYYFSDGRIKFRFKRKNKDKNAGRLFKENGLPISTSSYSGHSGLFFGYIKSFAGKDSIRQEFENLDFDPNSKLLQDGGSFVTFFDLLPHLQPVIVRVEQEGCVFDDIFKVIPCEENVSLQSTKLNHIVQNGLIVYTAIAAIKYGMSYGKDSFVPRNRMRILESVKSRVNRKTYNGKMRFKRRMLKKARLRYCTGAYSLEDYDGFQKSFRNTVAYVRMLDRKRRKSIHTMRYTAVIICKESDPKGGYIKIKKMIGGM